MEFKWIKTQIENGNYYLSKHAELERQNDNIDLQEIEEAISYGRIIELYEDTGRGVSCLVAGFTSEGKPVHIVCGKRGNSLVIITVYIAGPPKFKNIFKRGSNG